MTTILLHGWLAKVFIALLWLVALGLRIGMLDDAREDLLFSLIAFSNFLFYLMVATRLPLLTHSNMAVLLPNFPNKLRSILLKLLVVSLLPTLLLLPDLQAWLAFLSLSMVVTLIFVAMVYHPKYQVFIWFFLFMPIPLELFDIEFDKEQFFSALAYLLPIISYAAWVLLNKLVHYRGNKHHVSKILAVMNVSMGKNLAVQENIPFANRTKLAQWWANSHFNYYRKQIRHAVTKSSELSDRQVVAISCQSANSFGANTYLVWSLGIAFICFLGIIIDESYHHYFTPMVTLIPAMIIGTGSITLFQILQNKKSYLARLAVLPRFKGKRHFAESFLSFIFTNQVILYVFIAALIGISSTVFGHISGQMYGNILSILVIFALVSISIMLLALKQEQDNSNFVVWLLLIIYIAGIVLTMLITSNDMPLIALSVSYQIVFALSVASIVFSRYQYLKHFSK